jgi:hypothetical protein
MLDETTGLGVGVGVHGVVEVVAACGSGWKLSPVEANRWMEENLIPAYPLGDIKSSTLPK